MDKKLKVTRLYENRKPRAEWKDRYIYTMLGLFGGVIGLHNFYLNRKKIAFLQVLLSCCWIFLLALQLLIPALAVFAALFLWVILELFFRKYDIDGDLMNDEARPLRLLLIFVFLLLFVLLPLLFVLYIKI